MKSVQAVSRSRSLVIALFIVVTVLSSPAAAHEITGGAMRYTDPGSGEVTEFPLQHTSILAVVSGTVVEVTVTQKFVNPLQQRLEAVYVFPLPDRAAVDDMSIKTGDRIIKGEIHRREKAMEIYREAVAAGHLTGLLDQERPNIFTQRLANLLPGEMVEVEIHYVESLHYTHGDWRLVIPTVVGPRYIPGSPVGQKGSGWSPDTDQVPDASRITPRTLTPGTVSGHHIDIKVELEPGFPIADLSSPSHEVLIKRSGRKRAAVRLSPLDTIPNKDFELVWRTAGPAITTATVAHKVGDVGYLTLILQPPIEPRADQIVPREVVFVLDTSGSMSGEPVAACKQLTRKALKRLREGDTFRLIHFSNSASMFSRDALPATPQNIERALSYLDGLSGGGGTEMLEGVRAALDAPKDPNRLRMVLFLTDGYIGNEAQIVGRASSSLGDARIFALGIGKSVNRFLLDRLAEAGRGVAEYLRPGESPDTLVDRFYERIADPVFTQVELDWGDLDVVDVEPRQLRDLFASQPLLVHARYRSGGRGTVTLSGFAGSKRREIEVEIRLPKMEQKNQAQANLWARARIARLEMDKMRTGNQKVLIEEITELALEHRLMTAYTSFVAVLQSEIRDDGKLVTLDQPVPMPEGVSFERVFGDRDQASRQTPGAASLNSVSRMASPRASKAPAAAVSRELSGRSVADENMVLSVPDPLPLRIPGGPADGVASWEHQTEAVEVTRPQDSKQNTVSQVEVNPSEPAEIPAPLPAQATDRPAGVVPPIAISSDRDSGPNRAVTSTAQPNRRGWSVEIDLPLLAASLFLLLLTAGAWYMRRVTIV